ncbi:MAG TPA: ABC transporter permease [Phenylobacterium sp.]|nr:ABC transporter permease [Phenylobacterium sp.]
MTPFDPMRWRPAPFLPRNDVRDGALMFVIAVLSFLACLTALGAVASDRAARGWTAQLAGSATVVVHPRPGETPDSAAARAAETLSSVEGVAEAVALEKEKAEALIAPWLDDPEVLADLPVPRLVTVELDRRAPASTEAMTAALKARGQDATVDDHSTWMKEIKSAAGLTRWAAFGVFLLIAMATAAAIAFATRAGLAARRDIVEVLHLSGATDGFIARLFQVRFARMAALGGLAGAAGAAAFGAALRLIGGGEGLTPVLPVAWWDLSLTLACPIAAAGVAALAARQTAVALIGELT